MPHSWQWRGIMPIALVSLTNVFAEPRLDHANRVELENKRLILAQTYPCPRLPPGHIAPHLERRVDREPERDEQDAARVVANDGGDGRRRAGRRALSPRAGPRGDRPGRTTAAGSRGAVPGADRRHSDTGSAARREPHPARRSRRQRGGAARL